MYSSGASDYQTMVPRRRLRGGLRRDQLALRVARSPRAPSCSARAPREYYRHGQARQPHQLLHGQLHADERTADDHDCVANGLACSSNWQKGLVEVMPACSTESGNGRRRRDPLRSRLLSTRGHRALPPTAVRSRSPTRPRWSSGSWSNSMDGNAEQVRSQALKLEGVAPTASVTPSYCPFIHQVCWVNVCCGDAADAGSGHRRRAALRRRRRLRHVEQHRSPCSPTLAAGSLAFGTHRLKAIATDKLGLSAGSALITIQRPRTACPSTTIACAGRGRLPGRLRQGPGVRHARRGRRRLRREHHP